MKAAVFDVDGTILDTMPMWAGLSDIYLASFGIKPKEDLNKKFLSATVEVVAKYMKETYSLPISEIEIQKGIQKTAEDFYKNEVCLKPGILEYIQSLHKKGIPMIVASSGIKPLIEIAFKRLNILKYFGTIKTGDKNGPELFDDCLEFLGTKPEETFVFEDGIHAIETAKKMGFKTVAVKDIQENFDEIKKIADYTLEDML